jgi:hypothetical protein
MDKMDSRDPKFSQTLTISGADSKIKSCEQQDKNDSVNGESEGNSLTN